MAFESRSTETTSSWSLRQAQWRGVRPPVASISSASVSSPNKNTKHLVSAEKSEGPMAIHGHLCLCMATYSHILLYMAIYTLKYVFGVFGHVFWMAGLVFWVSGLVFWVSGLVFWMSGLISFASGRVFWVSGHVFWVYGLMFVCVWICFWVSALVFWVSVCLQGVLIPDLCSTNMHHFCTLMSVKVRYPL